MQNVPGICCGILLGVAANVSLPAIASPSLPTTPPQAADVPLVVSNSYDIALNAWNYQANQHRQQLGNFGQAKDLLADNLGQPSSSPTPNHPPEPDPSQPRIQDYRSVDPPMPNILWESVGVDVRNSVGSDDKHKRVIEPFAQFHLRNGDQIKLTSGWNFFDQAGIESINNYPLRLNWQRKIDEARIHVGAGVDFFDDLPAVPNFITKFDLPIGTKFDGQGRLSQGLIFSTAIDYGAYKFSAKSLQSRITTTQIKPSLYWQISPSTNFYGHYQFGIYNDGNYEQQVFSRLQQKLGPEFYIAANLFSWSYFKDEERTNGYFSPPDFLTYTGEIGWEGNVVRDQLKCRLSVAIGRQRNLGNYAAANTYNARCDARLSPDLALEVGYSLSNIRDRSSPDDFQTQELSGQLKYRFD
jgi:hypothetical protein